jgi:hypothetical protein
MKNYLDKLFAFKVNKYGREYQTIIL